MNERQARRRLIGIERELKYLRKRRDGYLKAQKKVEEKKKKRLTKKRRILLSILLSALISLGIMLAFTFLLTVEGDVNEARVLCFGFPFILLVTLIYMILGETSKIPFGEEVKGINCVLAKLEKEKKRIYSEFPHLEIERIEVRFGWNRYSLIRHVFELISFLFAIPGTCWFIAGDPRFALVGIVFLFLGFIASYVSHFEERSWENCWIRKELGVDPKRLYR